MVCIFDLRAPGFDKTISSPRLDSQRKACLATGIPGYPTWVIGKDFYSGEQSLAELERIAAGETAGRTIPDSAPPRPRRGYDREERWLGVMIASHS